MTRPVKRERGTGNTTTSADNGGTEMGESGGSASAGQAALRLRYLAVKNLIVDGREDICRADSNKFRFIFDELESLHHLVQKPREQVSDAEALLDITNSLVTCVKAHCNDEITASDFITCLLRDFGQQGDSSSNAEAGRDSINWKNTGVAVSNLLRSCLGCHTMIGPMNTELKQWKAAAKKHVIPTESIQPEDVDGHSAKEKTDTDENMATMFNILRKKKSVKLENLVLNRSSFAQTVENLFTLSFLVKDGRAEIKVNENGWHLVSPRNAAAASAVASGEAVYRHFVFRFDFKDWKLMASSVGVGEEVMPHRDQKNLSRDTQQDSAPVESQEKGPTTPIRKLSRNRGLVLQEKTTVEDSLPESGETRTSTKFIRKGKRKLT